MTDVDFDTRKYRRSAFIPDYRESMFPDVPDEPQYTHEIPFPPQSAAPSTRHSVWSAEPQKDSYNAWTNGYKTNPSRRNSVAPIFAKKAAAEASDTASVWRYSSSPSKTDLTDGHTNGVTNGNGTSRTSSTPVFARKSATVAGAESGSSSRRNSQSPRPLLKSKSGLIYGSSSWHDPNAPVFSPTAETDRSSIASFQTARENGIPASRRFSDGAGLSSKNAYLSYAVQDPVPQQQPNGTDTRTSRRHSDLSALNGAHNSPRNVSPVDSRRSVTMGQPSRSGAVSPITINRSNSPMGNRPRNGTATSGLVSPITMRNNGGFSGTASIRSGSSNAQLTSPLARNSMAASTSQTQPQPTANHGQKLSLNTQVSPNPASPANKKSPTPSEAEEEMDEVIALSPAGRAPIQSFRRSRSSLMLPATPGGDTSTQSLDTLVEDQDKRYFGQAVNMDDLVANNIENAFDRL